LVGGNGSFPTRSVHLNLSHLSPPHPRLFFFVHHRNSSSFNNAEDPPHWTIAWGGLGVGFFGACVCGLGACCRGGGQHLIRGFPLPFFCGQLAKVTQAFSGLSQPSRHLFRQTFTVFLPGPSVRGLNSFILFFPKNQWTL